MERDSTAERWPQTLCVLRHNHATYVSLYDLCGTYFMFLGIYAINLFESISHQNKTCHMIFGTFIFAEIS
jgi:hypothetical protein